MSSDQSVNILVPVAVYTSLLPFDFTKVIGQVKYMNQTVSNPRSSVFASMIALNKGASSLYTGASTMMVRAATYSIMRSNIYITLFTYSAANDKYKSVSTNMRSFYSGLASGITAFVLTPLDLIILRQQTDHVSKNPRGYKGLFDGIDKGGKNGYRHLYVGATLNFARWSVYASTLMAVYDSFSEFWPRVLGQFCANTALAIGCASFFACAFSMPFDNLKTKMQFQSDGMYKNASYALSRTLAREGFFGLYVGFWHYYMWSAASAYLITQLVGAGRRLAND
jgi:hypothetical protein